MGCHRTASFSLTFVLQFDLVSTLVHDLPLRWPGKACLLIYFHMPSQQSSSRLRGGMGVKMERMTSSLTCPSDVQAKEDENTNWRKSKKVKLRH